MRLFLTPVGFTFQLLFPCLVFLNLPGTNSRSKTGPKKRLLPRPVCYQHFCEKIVEATGGPIDFAAAWVAGDKADAADAVESKKGGAVEELLEAIGSYWMSMFYLDPFRHFLGYFILFFEGYFSFFHIFLRSLPLGGRTGCRTGCHVGSGAGVRTLPRQVGRERGNLSNLSMIGAGDGVLILVRIKTRVAGTRIT